MGVLAIWRYPVKAMLGELLEAVDLDAGGLEGDRRWVVVDDDTGERIANKRGPTDPRLRACRARLGAGGELVVELPGGTVATGAAEVAAALSELLGRRVSLVEHGGGDGGYLRTGGHHDFAPVHVVTTGELARLRAAEPEADWDARRFRPNLVLDGGDALGGRLRATSGATLEVGLPTPRCVVTTRATPDLPPAPDLLKRIARHSRWDLGPLGRHVCVGAYAEVEQAGRVAVGETLAFAPAAEPCAAVDRTVGRLTGA